MQIKWKKYYRVNRPFSNIFLSALNQICLTSLTVMITYSFEFKARERGLEGKREWRQEYLKHENVLLVSNLDYNFRGV